VLFIDRQGAGALPPEELNAEEGDIVPDDMPF
jgi:hypothetical protein